MSHIYEKVHANAIEQYQKPEKRRGGETQSAEEVGHKKELDSSQKEVSEKWK